MRVDIHVLDHGGNITDCASIAAITALAHFRFSDNLFINFVSYMCLQITKNNNYYCCGLHVSTLFYSIVQ